MEWKLERSAARKVKTDEDVLWAKIMKALGTDLRKIRKPHLQTLTKGVVDTELLLDEHTSQVDNQDFPITEEWLHQIVPSTEGNGHHGFSEKGSIRICEKPKCLWKGCKDGSKAECGTLSNSAHTNGFSLLEPQIRFHITGLRNDYYLNLLDWSQGNLIALALGSALHIWNGERNQIIESIDLCSSYKYIASVAWMKENAYLAFGTSDGEVQLWDIETQKRLQNMYGHMSVVGAMSWNGHMLSSGSRLGYIYHHDVRVAQHHIGMARQSKQSVCSLQWSPDNKLLACGSSDGLLNIWSNDQCATIQCKPLTSILHSSAVKAMLWCPWQSAVIATGGGMKDRSLHIWNISTPEDLKTTNSESQICSLVWLPKTEDIVTGQGHPYNKMNIWKYPDLSTSAEYYDHKGRVLHMALSPEGNRIFTAAADGVAYVWKCRM